MVLLRLGLGCPQRMSMQCPKKQSQTGMCMSTRVTSLHTVRVIFQRVPHTGNALGLGSLLMLHSVKLPYTPTTFI